MNLSKMQETKVLLMRLFQGTNTSENLNKTL